ncbi:MAG: energy transducer TonB [Candidatus Binatia bacterium]
MATISAASLMIRAMPSTPVHVPVELVNAPGVEELKSPEASPPAPTPKPKAATITAPKLLSKPETIETPASAPAGNTREKIKEPEKLMEPLPELASLPLEPGSVKGGWNRGERAGEAEGGAAGAGNLSGKSDLGVVDGSGLTGGGAGKGTTGLGRGAKGDGTGGGSVSGEALSGLAHPIGGYQVKPSYPESARLAGAQGVTLLKLRILETGKVGQVLIEQSAGHPDLDIAAAEAVKKWLFEPARQGKNPIAVWVFLPVKFELN